MRASDVDAQHGGAEWKSRAEGRSDVSGVDAGAHIVSLDTVLDLGECYNTIRFHLVQDQLLWNEEHRDEARRVLARLGLMVRSLVPARQRSRLRAQVVSPFERLIEDLGRGQRYENLVDTNHNLRDDFPDIDLSRYRREFVEPIDEAIRESRGFVESLLKDDDRALLTLQLGEILDQGVHPVDPDNFYVYVPTERSTPQVEPRRLGSGTVRHARRDIEEQLLANRTFWGGMVPPAESWPDEVRQLVGELPMLDTVPIGLLRPQAGEDFDAEGAIDLLRQSIRNVLESESATRLAASGPVVRPPRVSRRGQNEERDEWLYKRHLDRSRPWERILEEVNSKPGWHRLDSIQSVRAAISRFAKKHRLPGPRPRDPGNRNNST